MPDPDPTMTAVDAVLPAHVAVIMDGNGRWAETRGQPRAAGHREGLGATREAVRFFGERGVRALTLFAFSSENWRRPREEVEALFDLFVSAIEGELPELLERGVCLRFIGERARFPDELQQRMGEAERRTAENGGLELVIALGYGGRWDMQQAALRWARAQGDEARADDEAGLARYLSTAGLPDVDLLIRTGGEQRISNFLLWQAAYAELLFVDTLWPDMTTDDFERALQWYAGRQRRFGGVPGTQGEAVNA
ncbi:polyprenyl diphosphate synthase [Thioalkalivibrio sp. ALJ24]|uniref:polyprenyl diphosphate synthase n=1 Tax=Thioalkalivibrio sp. ALJ24 TaxID=545276 RepID=UPI00036B8D96|nr:polyprenyl diphosphate synthase [Thioalkalivibrio sp. ALJ24]